MATITIEKYQKIIDLIHNVSVEIEKDNNKTTYYLYNDKGCLASFTNKNKLLEYVKKCNYNITKTTHINYDLDYNNIPSF